MPRHKACIGFGVRLIARTKIPLAILGIAFLLFTFSGICSGTAGAKSATAHSCCPKPCCPTPDSPAGHGPSTSGCACIDRQPLAAPLPSPGGNHLIELPQGTLLDSAETPARKLRARESFIFSPEDPFLQFRQLLL